MEKVYQILKQVTWFYYIFPRVAIVSCQEHYQPLSKNCAGFLRAQRLGMSKQAVVMTPPLRSMAAITGSRAHCTSIFTLALNLSASCYRKLIVRVLLNQKCPAFRKSNISIHFLFVSYINLADFLVLYQNCVRLLFVLKVLKNPILKKVIVAPAKGRREKNYLYKMAAITGCTHKCPRQNHNFRYCFQRFLYYRLRL